MLESLVFNNMNLLLSVIPKLSWILANGSFFLFVQNVWNLESRLLLNEFLGRACECKVRVRSDQGNIYTLYVTGKNDVSALKEVFLDEVYKSTLSTAHVVFDLGANFGESTLYFRLRYPGAAIYAIEPTPSSYSRLEKTFSQDSLVTVMQMAVTEEVGTISMYVFEKKAMRNSLLPREGYSKKISVAGDTFDNAIERTRVDQIDIVKFDIEGAETNLHTSRAFHEAAFLIGEYHNELCHLPLETFVRTLEENNFIVSVTGNSNSSKAIIKATKQ